MKALWLQDGTLSLIDSLEAPAPAGDELEVTVALAGICGTDLAMLGGYAAFEGVPGHEFVGRVTAGPDAWLGKRVVAGINAGCGDCERCRRGLGKHCASRRVVGIRDAQGAFAARVCVPAANCLEVPDSLSDTAAALTEPVAAALEILSRTELTPSDRVLVIGAGRLGQLIAQVLATRTDRLEVLVRSRHRRAAFEPLGIDCVEAPGSDYDVVVEVTGHADGFAMAQQVVRPRGMIVLKSNFDAAMSVDMSRIVVDEVQLVGSRCGPMEEALKWLGEGRIRLDHLRFERFGLTDFQAAFDAARDPSIYKVLLAPDPALVTD